MTNDETRQLPTVRDSRAAAVRSEHTTRRIGIIAVLVGAVAVVAVIFVGCDRADERERDVRKTCIAAGGTWIGDDDGAGDGHCVRQVVP